MATGAMVNAFGATECTMKGNNPEAKPGAYAAAVRAQYQQHLLNDGGLAPMTARMQRKMGALAAAMPRQERELNLKDFLFDVVMRAAVAGVFSDALADNREIQENLFRFDAQFLPLLGGAPAALFPGVAAARAFLQRTMRFSFDASCPFMKAREELFREHLLSEHDMGCTQTSFLWASAANTMPSQSRPCF